MAMTATTLCPTAPPGCIMSTKLIAMRKLPLIAGFILLVTTVANCIASYGRARVCLDEDLNQALMLTIRDKGLERMRQDSIRAYRLLATPPADYRVLTIGDPTFQQHIRHEALRSRAFIAYHFVPRNGDIEVRMEGQAHCSMAFVWGMSDQRLSFWLGLASCLALLLSVKRRKRTVCAPAVTTMHLTPMQEQLMTMFMQAPDHRLGKQEICDALWPNKDNAAETLYTTIRRLRKELDAASEWEITSERGKCYLLKRRPQA